MAIQRQLRRGTKAENDAFTGAIGELVQDTDNDRIIVHDGSLAGGFGVPNHNDVISQYFQAVDGVGTDTITLELPYAPSAYAEYQKITFKPAANNTGAVTVNVNSLGAKDLQKDDGSGSLVALDADDLKADIPIDIVYDGTRFIAQLGGSGAFDLILKTSASSVASVEFTTALSGYKTYKIVLQNVKPVTDGTTLLLRVSTDSGASYVSTNDYYTFGSYVGNADALTGIDRQSTRCELTVNGLGAGNNTNEHINANIEFNDLSISGTKNAFFACNYFTGATNAIHVSGAFYFKLAGTAASLGTINGIQFFFSSGNILQGDFYLYGVKG